MLIITMNFAYLRFKDGASRTLSPDQCDVVAILEASNLLGKRWRSVLKLFKEEKRIDSIFRVYYPIYLVRIQGKIIAVDGIGIQETRFNEDGLFEGAILNTRTVFQPVFGTDLCNWLGEWHETSSEAEEIRNGFAISPVLSKDEATNAATEVMMIHDSDLQVIEKIEKEISALNDQYNRAQLELTERQKALLDEFDRKISLKGTEIEGLETYSEMKTIEELKANFGKKLESIRSRKMEIERRRKEITGRISELEKEKEKLLSRKEALSRRASALNRRLESLLGEREKLNAGGAGPKMINENITNAEKISREVDKLQREIEGCVSRFNKVVAEIGILTESFKELERELATLNEKERLLPSKEEEEVDKVHRCFSGRREILVKELMELTEEKERGMMELRAEEKQERIRYSDKLRRLQFLLAKAKEDYQAARSIMIQDEDGEEWETEMIQIPFYVYISDGEFRTIEPQIIIGEHGKVVKSGGTCLVQGGGEYLQANWDALAVLLFKARDSFNLLSLENRRRIIAAAESLRSMGVINNFQLSYIMAVETK
ncbi:MAG: hypothetical protein H5T33_01480 [Candidatus Methanosuratus sp.]|nr:hypothetical protein [Candidatus Methanosuratincola sp.]